MRIPTLVCVSLLAGCTPGGVAAPAPWLGVPDEVVVDGATLGIDNPVRVRVENVGTAVARVQLAVEPPYRVTSGVVVIEAGQTAELVLLLVPVSYASVNATLSLLTNTSRFEVPLAASVSEDADADGVRALGAGGTDCDDLDPEVYPGREEICDGRDNDCNLVVDDVADPPAWYLDADGDGYGRTETLVKACAAPARHVSTPGDCDDGDDEVSPAASEVYYDGVDQNCDGASDYDMDRDGFDRLASGGADCVDSNPAIHPGATDACYDGLDQDCDGSDDYDCDGDGVPVGQDCDDLESTVRPGAPELEDGVDNDCDGYRDEEIVNAGDLVITEMLIAPSLGTMGQWFEVLNVSADDASFDQLTLSTEDDAAVLTGTLLAGETGVWCASVDPLVNGGVSCTSPLPLPLGRYLALEFAGQPLDVVDTYLWGQAPEPGVAWSLDPSEDDLTNDGFDRWCLAQAPWASGDLGSPGLSNPICP